MLAPDGGGWSTPRHGRFTPGKETRYVLYRRLSEPQVWSRRVRIISPTPGFAPRIVQAVAIVSAKAPKRISHNTCLHSDRKF
jgi:hypothetical protein